MKYLIQPSEIESRLERILLRVQKPGRYVGGELNQVVKPWDETAIHVALAFPDIYDLGLPNLGVAILYDRINQRPDALAERVYCPWVDMEATMRANHIPLYALESKHAIADFDILGITLPYETLYTNTLNLLDLAGIPLLAGERTEDHPLVIAGGHATFNPEPMSAFIDAFVIGEGEEVMGEILDVFQDWKNSAAPRSVLLQRLGQVWGVYVPTLYEPRYHPDGTIASVEKLDAAAPLPVRKRILAQLPPPLTRFIVPSIDVVHNRIAVEIMRGCTRGCRFCHAGMVTRPVRQRPVNEIVDAIQAGLESTGFEEIALLSLSSSDYTHILELVEAVSQRFNQKHLTISLPSLRVESFSIDLVEKLRGARQGSFTLAPEAATESMQRRINKPIPLEQLIETARAIYSRGWQTIKLYFMIGHPEETLEDVQAIADLCQSIIREGRKLIGRRSNLNMGIGTFVPKPHTPFQWVAGDLPEQIEAKQRLLMRSLRGPGLKLNWTDSKETLLESWLSRGDRRMAQVILGAWQRGAKFDAWQDQFRYDAWQEAFSAAGLEPAFYTHRARPLAEVLPWDHISTGVSRSFLEKEYQRGLQGELLSDCRETCHACGLQVAFKENVPPLSKAGWYCP